MSHPGPLSSPTVTDQPVGPAGEPRVHLARGYSMSLRVTAIAIGAIGAVGLVIARIWPVASVDSGPPTCLFRLLFNLPCPGCGMTRSWVHLAHGDVAGALVYNPFGVLLMGVAAAAAVYVLVALVRRRPPERMFDILRPRPAAAILGIWIAWSIYRMWSISAGQDFWATAL